MIVHMIHNSIVCHFLPQMHSLPLPASVIPRRVEGGGGQRSWSAGGWAPWSCWSFTAMLKDWWAGEQGASLASFACASCSMVDAALCVCVVSSRSCTCAGAGSAAATEAPEDAWHWDREHQTSRDTGGLQQRVCRGQKSRWGTGRAPGAHPLDFFFPLTLSAARTPSPHLITGERVSEFPVPTISFCVVRWRFNVAFLLHFASRYYCGRFQPLNVQQQ